MRTTRRIALAGAYLALYLLLEWVSYARPVLAPGITPWHPQSGLTLALLIVGPEWCVVAVIGALLSQILLHPPAESFAVTLAGSVWIAGVFTLLAVLSRRLLMPRAIRNTVDAARFSGLVGVLTLVNAAGFVGLYIASGAVSPADALRGIARYWFADMNGVLMLTPLLLAGNPRTQLLPLIRGRVSEIAVQVVLVAVILAVIFALPDNEQLRFFYLLFVPVIWIALRWDLGALLAVLAIQTGLILAAEAELHTPRFIDTQLLMLTLTLTALLLGSVVLERRRSQLQLRERDAELSRAMRFAVAGELASATAHELNQPMTALVSYLNAAEILAGAPGDDERLRSTVRKAAQEGLRAADVLHRLRNFYIGGRSRRDRINLDELCHASAAEFTEPLARARVSLDVFVAPGLPPLEADETQLRIVLHNLIANAVDATQDLPGEKRIELWATADEREVSLVVEDSGAGIPGSLADRLFEPFVTSKAEGMGLGLAISRTLVRARGGEITSLPGQRLRGARLRVTLPIDVPGEPAA